MFKYYLGNDFVALSSAFARRNASEIKRKFIRENKQNSRKIDELLQVHATGQSNWDLTHLREKDAQYYKALDDIEEKKGIESTNNAGPKTANVGHEKKESLWSVGFGAGKG